MKCKSCDQNETHIIRNPRVEIRDGKAARVWSAEIEGPVCRGCMRVIAFQIEKKVLDEWGLSCKTAGVL